MAQKITKNLNPIYGSIQALKTRDSDVVVLTEDKVLKVFSLNKSQSKYGTKGAPLPPFFISNSLKLYFYILVRHKEPIP